MTGPPMKVDFLEIVSRTVLTKFFFALYILTALSEVAHDRTFLSSVSQVFEKLVKWKSNRPNLYPKNKLKIKIQILYGTFKNTKHATFSIR